MGLKTSKYIIDLQNKFGDKVLSHTEICEHIDNRLIEIDKELHAADALRIEKMELIAIKRDLGMDSSKRQRTSQQVPAIDLADNSDEMIDIRRRICEALNEYGPLTNREVIQKAGSYAEESKYFRAIKFLGEQDIIQRDEQRKLIPGKKWEERSR